MSNHKMQFPSHISKSWLSVCIFIFLLTVCVGLAIHVTSEEDAICSDSDHSEVPIVSNENVSEKSGSDIEYAKNLCANGRGRSCSTPTSNRRNVSTANRKSDRGG